MNLILRVFTPVAVCIFLMGCGSEKEESAVESEAPSVTSPKTPKPVNNPLASQQQLLRDAKGIQSILDQDEERKNKALNSAD